MTRCLACGQELPETACEEALTKREVEVARLVATGMDDTEIATALALVPQTVRNYVSSIFLKLSIKNRVQLTLWVLRNHEAAQP